MSLGHVYIVLEPVGSACLTFDGDRYYEFMCFDVPKVVRSPGYHGHDEESRNGRDMKIDILDDYIRTPEWFRGVSGIYRSTGGLPEPPGELMGLNRPLWKRGGGGQGGPPKPNPNWEGGRPPFPSVPLPLPSSPTPTREGGKPTPTGSRTPPLGRAIEGRPSPPPLLYIRGRGAPYRDTS